jgi:hypothetical protein
VETTPEVREYFFLVSESLNVDQVCKDTDWFTKRRVPPVVAAAPGQHGQHFARDCSAPAQQHFCEII